MSALRCSICGTSWPSEESYNPCPECEEPTDIIWNAQPISREEAASRKNHADFERYLAERGRD
jgi:hypothetical protein